MGCACNNALRKADSAMQWQALVAASGERDRFWFGAKMHDAISTADDVGTDLRTAVTRMIATEMYDG